MQFCEGVAQAQTAIAACEAIGVAESTVWDWLAGNAEFSALYARARERRGERMAQWILDIVGQVASGELAPDVARVMCDQLKWLAAKWYPRTYGDHSHKTVTVQPGDGYAALLEAIDDSTPKLIDVTPKDDVP